MNRIVIAVLCLLTSVSFAHAESAPGKISITSVWARPTLGQSKATAAYLKLENLTSQEDTLIGISTPLAAMADMHDTFAAKDNIMQMRRVDALRIKPGQVIDFKPGGMHIMIMSLTRPLKEGETIPLTLRFMRSGTIEVTADVRMQAP